MSELKQYFDCFEARLQAPEGLPAERCRCHGSGWIFSEVDTVHQCRDHFNGQRHPEDDSEFYEELAAEDEAARAADPDAVIRCERCGFSAASHDAAGVCPGELPEETAAAAARFADPDYIPF